MSLFDAYVMVDWSGSDRRRGGRADCIWIAHGLAISAEPSTVSPPSRTDAEQLIRAQIESIVTANKGRVLLCADFGYGYPAGFASLLANSVDGALPPWRIVWQYLSKHLQDDLGTKPGQQPTNRSNRFEVASAINAAVSGPTSPGPFWCLFKPGGYVCIPQKKPAQRSYVRAALSLGFVSPTGERKAIPRFASSARAASAARCSPASRAFTPSASIRSSLDAPPFGLSRQDGHPELEHGSIHRCEFSMLKSIRAFARLSPTRSKTAAKCARCGTGRAASTLGTH
jgi:hypothetical protein